MNVEFAISVGQLKSFLEDFLYESLGDLPENKPAYGRKSFQYKVIQFEKLRGQRYVVLNDSSNT